MPVEVFSWNPVRPVLTGRVGRRLPYRRPVNNFGDLIGPMLVERIVASQGLDTTSGHGRLLTVGSVLHFAHPGDVIWGSGINGKAQQVGDPAALDIRAVRGPLTRAALRASGAQVPEVFGDPALIWPVFWPKDSYPATDPRELTVVPNFHDWPAWRHHPAAVSPRAPVHEVVGRIANSRFVTGSSLHGVILAESFGIPARFMRSDTEPSFKYEDYLGGTGRTGYTPAGTLDEALALGGQDPIEFDAEALLSAFPADLWHAKNGSA